MNSALSGVTIVTNDTPFFYTDRKRKGCLLVKFSDKANQKHLKNGLSVDSGKRKMGLSGKNFVLFLFYFPL